ncbi:MAG: Rv2993c-like domain-containing protein, partial [Actinomycetota bacterium]
MRIVSYTAHDGTARFGIAENERVLDAGSSFDALTPGEEAGPIEELSLRAPVPATSKVVCVGLNYV